MLGVCSIDFIFVSVCLLFFWLWSLSIASVVCFIDLLLFLSLLGGLRFWIPFVLNHAPDFYGSLSIAFFISRWGIEPVFVDSEEFSRVRNWTLT